LQIYDLKLIKQENRFFITEKMWLKWIAHSRFSFKN